MHKVFNSLVSGFRLSFWKQILFFAVLISLVLSSIKPLSALTLQEAQQEQIENTRRQRELEAELEGVSQDLSEVVLKLDNVENVLIPQVKAEVKAATDSYKKAKEKSEELNLRVEKANDLLDALKQSITDATNDQTEVHQTVALLARSKMKGKSDFSFSAILNPTSIEEYVRNLENETIANKIMKRILDETNFLIATGNNSTDRIKEIEAYIDELAKEAEAAALEAKKQKKIAEDKKVELEDLEYELAGLKAYYEEKKVEIEAAKAEAKEKENELQAIIADLVARQYQNGGSFTGPAPGAGFFGWPLSNIYVTQYYGGYDPDTGLIYNPNHQGVDFGASCGTPIYSVATGIVTEVDYGGGAGNYVLIDHGILGGTSYMTIYMHMTSQAAYPGQAVAQGQVIGYVGTTGNSSGCHLHLGLYINGRVTDPWPYLN